MRAQGGEAIAVRCDITKVRDTLAMARQVKDAFGRIDVLVNNAAIFPRQPFLDMTLAFWKEHLDINLTGQFLCCKAVVPRMINQKAGGSIINLSSLVSIWSSVPGLLAYSTGKAAVNRFSSALAQELKPYDIAVNALDPGAIRSEGVVDYVLEKGASPLEEQGYYWAPPLPRVIGPSVIWLARQRANTFTGYFLHRVEFGKKWGPGIKPPPSPLDMDVSHLRARPDMD